MEKLSIRDLEMTGKRVFIRVDFNVPLDGARVSDDTRIRETLPTLRLAVERDARLVLASHLGRPKGKVNPKYSLAPVAGHLSELIGKHIEFASDCFGPEAEEKSIALTNGEILLLENVRFHPEEEANDADFSKKLAALCDGLFVCDAFGSSHRAHASVVGITKFVNQSAAGLLMEKELAYLGRAISNPTRPFVAVLGGAKVSDKIEVVRNLMTLADSMLIGGAMAYTFLKSEGLPVGNSLVENDKLGLARNLLEEARSRKFRLLLPVDHVLAESPESATTKTADIADIPAGWVGLDIGPKTIELFRQEISKARTIVWNGPLGMFERPAFAQGTLTVARAVAAATTAGATSIIGGGDSVAAAEQSGVAHQISHISTGGGASLEFLAGEKLPGVEALTDKPSHCGVPLRRPVIAGNWKMYKTRAETRAFFEVFKPLVGASSHCDIVIAPPFTAIPAAVEAASGTPIGIAAQNMYWQPEGAFTGEISASMLVEAGCRGAIIGHSERRQYFGETDEWVNRKTKAALAAGLTPIVCVGETLAERECDQTHSVCQRQLEGGLASLTDAEFSRIVVAYEPVWAIGTGRTATPEIAQSAHRHIRELAAKQFGARASELRILYGGSVKPDNIKGLMAQADIDGALVGGASLDPRSFAAIVNF